MTVNDMNVVENALQDYLVERPVTGQPAPRGIRIQNPFVKYHYTCEVNDV
nr:hypothetical protein [uncultured Desulfobacter sp.]